MQTKREPPTSENVPESACSMEVARNQSLRNLTYAVIDVETTGLSALAGDRICEIAVVLARGGQIVNQFQTLINPERPISYGAMAVNGISNSMVRSAPSFRAIARSLADLLDGAVLVAHNASFDLSFISAELRAAGVEPPNNPVIDTLALAKRDYSFASNKLGNVARSLGIQALGLHRALADATITWHILDKFIWNLEAQGIHTLDELLAHQGSITPLSGWKMMPPLMEWDGTQPYCPIQGLPPLIEQAVRARSALRIRYSSGDGRESERVVHPLKVTLRAQATYLVAYCHLMHEERTFRMDRIVHLTVEELVG